MGNGTYPVYEPHKASLFRLDGSKITKVARNISVSNGLAWDLKQKAMYYVDSLEYNIRRYDYDVETGKICKNFYSPFYFCYFNFQLSLYCGYR